MPERRSKSSRSPKYRRQRRHGSSDRAFVEVDGSRHYLGDFDSPESREAYRRLIVEWATGGAYTAVPQDEITVIELADRFWQHAQRYYRNADGSLTTTPGNYKAGLKIAKRLYGRAPAGEFGPRHLKTVRDEMIRAGVLVQRFLRSA